MKGIVLILVVCLMTSMIYAENDEYNIFKTTFGKTWDAINENMNNNPALQHHRNAVKSFQTTLQHFYDQSFGESNTQHQNQPKFKTEKPKSSNRKFKNANPNTSHMMPVVDSIINIFGGIKECLKDENCANGMQKDTKNKRSKTTRGENPKRPNKKSSTRNPNQKKQNKDEDWEFKWP